MTIQHGLGRLFLLAVRLGLSWWLLLQKFTKVHQKKVLSGQGQRQRALQFTKNNGLFGGINNCSQVATNTVGNEKRCFGLHNGNFDQESIYWY